MAARRTAKGRAGTRDHQAERERRLAIRKNVPLVRLPNGIIIAATDGLVAALPHGLQMQALDPYTERLTP